MRERTHLNHVVSVLYPPLPAIGPQQIEVYNRALANQGRNPSALRLVEELIPDVQDPGIKTRRWPGSWPTRNRCICLLDLADLGDDRNLYKDTVQLRTHGGSGGVGRSEYSSID